MLDCYQIVFMFLNKVLKYFFPFSSRALYNQAQSIYWHTVKISRQTKLYKNYLIPDSFDGRFDSLLMHIFPLLVSLQKNNNHALCQEILKILTYDMERSLREMGVGDPSIARKMRKIGEGYMGRMTSYQKAIEALPDTSQLKETLWRNIYAQDPSKKEALDSLTTYFINTLDNYESYIFNPSKRQSDGTAA